MSRDWNSELRNHFVWKNGFGENGIFSDLSGRKEKIINLVRIFYLVTFFLVFEQINTLTLFLDNEPTFLLWPVKWLSAFNVIEVVPFLFLLALIILLSTAVWVQSRMLRILSLIIMLVLLGLQNSYGKISHNYHHLYAPLVGFILLPRKESENDDLLYSYIFSGTQLLFLFTYSLSGLLKFVNGLVQFFSGEESMLSIYSLTNHLIKRTLVGNGDFGVYGDWVIDHPFFGFLLLLGAIYLELAAVLILFKPRLHRLWGIGIMMMHTGIALVMNIHFVTPILLSSLLLVASPFAPKVHRFYEIVYDLPFFGPILRTIFHPCRMKEVTE